MFPAERNPFHVAPSQPESTPETLRSIELPQSGVRSQQSVESWKDSMPPPSSVEPWDLMTDDEDAPMTLRSGAVPIVDRSADRYREGAVMKHDRQERENAILAEVIEPMVEIERQFRGMYSGDFNRRTLVKRANFVFDLTKNCEDVRLVKLRAAMEVVQQYVKARTLSTAKLVAAKKAVTRWLDEMEKEEGQEMLNKEMDQLRARKIREEIEGRAPEAQRSREDDESQYPSEGVL